MKMHLKQKLGFLFSLNVLLSAFFVTKSLAQTTAGNAAYNFLELPYSAKATALGGLNISSIGSDIGLAMYNPSLLNARMDNELHISVKPYYDGIQQYDLFSAQNWEAKKIAWGVGVHFLDYGNIQMTDIIGNEIGTMHPSDYAVQVSASSDYINNFRIGSSFKYIHSNYGMFKSNAIAMDIGLKYLTKDQLMQVSLLVKNVGIQLGTSIHQQELPFNIILGWTKKIEYAPIQFSLTADRLSVWNNLYFDPVYANSQSISTPNQLQNLFNHLTLGSEVFIGKQVNLDLGYNFIRRYDLNIQDQSNGLNGFSTGVGLQMERMKVQYGNSFFQSNLYHHFSISYQLKKSN
jgi:hypothetical protein